MQPSRNVRLAYGVRVSTLPLFRLSYDKNGNRFAVLLAFCRLADSEKRIYRYEYFIIKGEIIMMKTKPVYNYDLEQVTNLLLLSCRQLKY